MIFQRLWTRLRRAWLLIIIVLTVLGITLRLGGDRLRDLTAGTCDAAPTFGADVPRRLQAELNYLFDNKLLYCEEPQRAFLGLKGPIYWGSEGTTSILFFQAESLDGVGVTRYGFGSPGDLFQVTPMGGAPPAGYGELRAGAPVIRNQAEGDAPNYFVHRAGPPPEGDVMVSARVRGPSTPDTRVIGNRDVVSDVTRLWDRLRGRQQTDPTGGGSTVSEVFFAIWTGRWDIVIGRDVNPELDIGEEASHAAALRKANEDGVLDGPAWYQTVSGELASAVWAAGVLTETRPAMRLLDAEGSEVPPIGSGLFQSSVSGIPLAMFGYAPQPTGVPFEAELWLDERARADGAEPDLRFPVTFP